MRLLLLYSHVTQSLVQILALWNLETFFRAFVEPGRSSLRIAATSPAC